MKAEDQAVVLTALLPTPLKDWNAAILREIKLGTFRLENRFPH
ncbi:MAG: hypothetical protein ACREX3_19215 [Gammaproteobacteria bacterium]